MRQQRNKATEDEKRQHGESGQQNARLITSHEASGHASPWAPIHVKLHIPTAHAAAHTAHELIEHFKWIPLHNHSIETSHPGRTL